MPLPLAAADDWYAAAAAGNHDRSTVCNYLDERYVSNVLWLRRRHAMPPSAPRVLSHFQAHFRPQSTCFLLSVEIADRLRRIAEGRILWINLNLREQAHDVARAIGSPQRIFQRLHQQIGNSALAVRDADVERHRLHAIPRQRLTKQDVADDGTIAMGENELGIKQHQRQKRLRECGGHFRLLIRGPANTLGVRRIAADSNDKARRDLISWH